MRVCRIPTSRTKPTKSGRIFGGSADLCASSNAISDSDTAPISETALAGHAVLQQHTVIRLDVSQSQTSLPARSMARIQ